MARKTVSPDSLRDLLRKEAPRFLKQASLCDIGIIA